MSVKNKETANLVDREITHTRIFNAPRELVWQAMTDPQHVVHWWGPRGFTTTIEEMDVRPGGVWKHVMHGPDGTDYPNKSIFIEVVKPERIVYSHGGAKKGGTNAQFEATWSFDELETNKTCVTVRMIFPSAEIRNKVAKEYGAVEGLTQTLQRLEERLAYRVISPESAFVLSRTFDAPREIVFKAWTEAERLVHWWGPKGLTNRVITFDLRPGGIFHYVLTLPDGKEMWGKWIIREVTSPEQLIFISSFSDKDGAVTRHPFSATWPLETLTTVSFVEHEGKTTLTLRGVPINATTEEIKTFKDGRESMQKGFGGTLEQLVEYLAKT